MIFSLDTLTLFNSHFAHASGHIYPKDLVELIQEINPSTLIPVHTEHPEKFKETFSQTRLLTDGETFEL